MKEGKKVSQQKQVSNISVENAQIVFRNFSGKEGKYNPEGNRNFGVLLDDDISKQLEEDGWNVRWLKPRDPEESPQGFLQVKVGFGNYPPKIVLISNGKKSELNENTVYILDWAELETVDLIIRPYSYDVNGRQGIKAYLKTMYVVLAPDKFAEKYEDTPDSAQNGV